MRWSMKPALYRDFVPQMLILFLQKCISNHTTKQFSKFQSDPSSNCFTIDVWKLNCCPTRDSNPQHMEHESSTLFTRTHYDRIYRCISAQRPPELKGREEKNEYKMTLSVVVFEYYYTGTYWDTKPSVETHWDTTLSVETHIETPCRVIQKALYI